MDAVKHGVLHEVGEYHNIQPLSDKDNNFVNEQDKKDESK